MKSAIFRNWIALWLLAAATCLGQSAPVELHQDVGAKFSFIAYGDTRFTSTVNTEASNAPVRQELVAAIARVKPAFISIGGDLVYTGDDPADWRQFDADTLAWRAAHIPVYPAIGNHELKGDTQAGLGLYFQHFPDLKANRYYSVRAGSVLVLTLDTNLDITTGPQSDWLNAKLDSIPAGVEFVVIVLHHPPITSSTDDKSTGGGHAARPAEQQLAQRLEERQKSARVRFVVVSGHVHNYERHERNGVLYFVSGGGGAHAYPIHRNSGDLYPDNRINYHYLLFLVEQGTLTVTMNRLEMVDGKPAWTGPDSAVVHAVAPVAAAAK